MARQSTRLDWEPPPCQSFSAAGKQEGFSDSRHLWPELYRLITQCGPDAVFCEQVATAIRHGWLDLVYDNLEASGYSCGSIVLPAGAFGAPHRRERLYVVAHSGRRQLQQRDGLDVGEAPRGSSSKVRQQRVRADSGASSDTIGVGQADADSRGSALERCGRVLDNERAPLGNNTDRCGKDGGVGTDDGVAQGHAVCAGLEGHFRHGDDRDESGRIDTLKAGSVAAPGRPSCYLADTASARYSRGENTGADCSDAGTRARGLEFERSSSERSDAGSRENITASPATIPWRNCVWLPYRDGKYRPVESVAEPLADELSSDLGHLRIAREDEQAYTISHPLIAKGKARKMRLSGYGNAIVPEVAAAVIVAFLEATS
jgi:DNA (cytosine-5)-methyltransferase 1